MNYLVVESASSALTAKKVAITAVPAQIAPPKDSNASPVQHRAARALVLPMIQRSPTKLAP